MLALTLAAQISLLAALGYASPVEQKRSSGHAVLSMRSKPEIRSADRVFNKERALRDHARVLRKFKGKQYKSGTGDSDLSKRSGGEPFDINSLRKRAKATKSAKEPLTDDYDGIDECASNVRTAV